MKLSAKIVMGIIISVMSPFLLHGQMPDPVHFSITKAPETVKAGQEFSLTIKAAIEKDWHLYSVNNDPDAGPFPTKFSASNNSFAITGAVEESKPLEEYDPNFKTDLGWHENNATFTIPVAFVKKVSRNAEAAVNIRYQVCNDKVCLPSATKSLKKIVEVDGIADQPVKAFSNSLPEKSAANVAGATAGQDQIKTTESSVASGGLLWYIWLAITAGFGALISPCVYPMIPLTVSFFSKKGGGSRREAMGPALGFGLAIVTLFTIIGLLLSLLIGVSGANQFAANPWVNLFIALVLIIFAISLLGAFEIRLPYQLTNWLNKKSNESSGVIGILFIALTISAVSFSCTVPFVGGVLTATSRGEWFYPAVGMIFFSAAFASPFVLLAMFPSWLESLPQSGSWMNVIKVLLGFIELGAAFKFLSNADLVWNWGLISRPFTIAAWIAVSLLAGLYVLGVYAMKHEEKPESIGTRRLLLAMPFILFSFYLIPGLMGASMGIWDAWLPPRQATDVSVVSSISQLNTPDSTGNESSKWSQDYQASVDKASKAGKPIFIDFTGYTCTNCRAMETNVFPRASVQRSFNKMELVRLYTDAQTKGRAYQKFQLKLTGTVAIPTYVILDPKSEKVIRQLEGLTDKEKFQKFLQEGLTTFQQQNSTI